MGSTSANCGRHVLPGLSMVAMMLFAHVSWGQIVSYRDRNVVDYQDYVQYAKSATGDNAGSNYAGSPYLENEFKDGIIYIEKNSKSSPIPMRYNQHTDQMEFKRGNFVYIMNPALSIDLVVVGDNTFILGESVVNEKYSLGFFEMLDTGKVNLMKKQTVRLREAQPPKALESQGTPPTYLKLGYEYFYQIGDGEVFKISSVKKFTDELPDNNEAMAAFTKKEKISKKEADLLKMVRYYNSLIRN